MSKQKKMDTRVNFTPMVDMMMLLITFFMLCTTLSKPQAMQLTMPSNDDQLQKEDKSVTKASYTITIRDVLMHHTTEDGTNPVAQVMQAKVELDKKKLAAGDKMSDEEYQKQLSAIKSGDIYGNGQKIQTMTVIIKPMDTANYNNMVQALDEMQICSIGKYVIDKINEDDEKLLTLKGIKFAVD